MQKKSCLSAASRKQENSQTYNHDCTDKKAPKFLHIIRSLHFNLYLPDHNRLIITSYHFHFNGKIYSFTRESLRICCFLSITFFFSFTPDYCENLISTSNTSEDNSFIFPPGQYVQNSIHPRKYHTPILDSPNTVPFLCLEFFKRL